jgi:5-methylcytosine-specific restriction endonuclease McrA
MDHYKKQNEKFLNIEPKTKLQEQAKLRATVFKRDNYECVECKSSLGLQCSCNVYKKEYDSFDDEVDSYKTLCYECVRREKEL